jgi:hypothetical protein
VPERLALPVRLLREHAHALTISSDPAPPGWTPLLARQRRCTLRSVCTRLIAALAALVLACSAEHGAPPFSPDTTLGALTSAERAEFCHWLRARTALDGDFVEASCAYEALQGSASRRGCAERRSLCMFIRAGSAADPGCFAELADEARGCAGTRVRQHTDCIHELRSRVLPFEGVECSDSTAQSARAAEAQPAPPAAEPAPACVALLDDCPSALLEWGIE